MDASSVSNIMLVGISSYGEAAFVILGFTLGISTSLLVFYFGWKQISRYFEGQINVFRDYARGGRKLGFGQTSYGKGFYTYSD